LEILDFQDKKWRVIAKVEGGRIDDPSSLKGMYGADLVLKNRNTFFILEAIIDAEFEEL
tara:strand:+ start:433 stop:609 length:177 start_codon:yes stop_codon:yes gene_type:complete